MTDERTKHTPTPWYHTGANVFAKSDCIAICDTDNAPMRRMEANAAFIVRAANHHDEAIAWIEAALGMVDGSGVPPNWDGMRDFLKRAKT